MSDILAALYAFWSQFGIPAYLSDQVPEKATYPYITYTAASGAAFSTSVIVAYAWYKGGNETNTDRRKIADAIADAIPNRGALIELPSGGCLVLDRGSDFQTLYQDPEDEDVIAVRTSVEVRYYT